MEILDSPTPSVLYIAGYGRSGSTFVCRILGQNQDICGAGELVHIGDWIKSSRVCSCGEPIPMCPFWSGVASRLTGVAGENSNWRVAIESAATLMFGYWWIPRYAREVYRNRERRVFREIAAAGNALYVVDCSKSDYRTAGRARALSDVAGLDVRVLHLIRNPHAVAESLAKGTNRELEGRLRAVRWMRRTRAFVGWSFSNAVALLLARRMPEKRVLRVHFEVMNANVGDWLAAIGKFVGLPMSRAIEVLDGTKRVRIEHLAEGNRMRFDPLELKRAARVSPTWFARLQCALICGPICCALGFAFDGRSLKRIS